MIMSMYKVDWSRVLAVTNRHLCAGDFLSQVEKIAAQGPKGIILREKDLSATDYECLAKAVSRICQAHAVPLYVHTFSKTGEAVRAAGVHLPLPQLRKLAQTADWRHGIIGTSCHSVAEVQEAAALGCSYVLAGHIYDTNCKRGLPGRGLDFLQAACRAAGDMSVYAIGGITPARLPEVLAAKATGVCVMSGMMQDSAWWR